MSVNVWQAPNTWSSGGNPPQGVVTIASVTPTTITASVSYSYSDSDQDGFEYRLDGGTPVNINNDNPFLIAELTADTTYSVEVRAYNSFGQSDWSTPFVFMTEEEPISPVDCFVGFVGVIIDDTNNNPIGFNGVITGINGFDGGLCNDVCDS